MFEAFVMFETASVFQYTRHHLKNKTLLIGKKALKEDCVFPENIGSKGCKGRLLLKGNPHLHACATNSVCTEWNTEALLTEKFCLSKRY